MIALPPKLRDHRALVSIRPATDRLLGSIDYIATVLAAFSGNRLLGSIHYIATVFHGRLLLATTSTPDPSGMGPRNALLALRLAE
jgi:hypothetical protein